MDNYFALVISITSILMMTMLLYLITKRSLQEGKKTEIKQNLPQNNPNFINREFEKNKLIELLSPKSEINFVNLTGMGGIGKTALAIEVAYYFIDHKIYDGIVYVSAFSNSLNEGRFDYVASRNSSIDSIISAIIYTLSDRASTFQNNEDRREFARSLLTKNNTLLLIDSFDSFENTQLITDFVKLLPATSKALIISRYEIDAPATISLSALNHNESMSLLQSYLQDNQSSIKADQLSEIVDLANGNPLVITLFSNILKKYSEEDELFNIKKTNDEFTRFLINNFKYTEDSIKIILSLKLLNNKNLDINQIMDISEINNREYIEETVDSLIKNNIINIKNNKIDNDNPFFSKIYFLSKMSFHELENQIITNYEKRSSKNG